MGSEISPLTIEIVPRGEGRFKSIVTLSWADIPGFAILTGKNGSGKTQFLEILVYHLSGAVPPGIVSKAAMPVDVRVSGTTYRPYEIAFVPSSGRFSGGPGASLATIQQMGQHALQHAQSHTRGAQNDIPSVIRAHRILSRLGGRAPHELSQEQLNEILIDADFVADDIDITVGLSHVFVTHRLKILEAIERNTPGIDEKGNPLGPAPWEVVNEALLTAGFPYTVISPSKTKLTDHYRLRLKDSTSGIEIDAVDLSSGEKVLLQLVLWLYTAGSDGKFPKLLLLDEPDAHLHPSMTTQFLDVISDVLVSRYGVRVIMTTHSPSTVALAPDGAVFQLDRGGTHVKKIDQRPDIISILTAGLVTVSRATKFCFVEDEDDVAFYKAVTEILMDHGPSRDPMALQASPSLVFIPASVGTGRGKIPGGCTNVQKWVSKLDADPLDRTFFGIIDRDAANKSSARVYVIGRYSFENYLLDPINLFCLLIEQGNAPAIPHVKISSGDEHILRLQTNTNLQAIVDLVAQKMELAEPQLATSNILTVTYTNGAQISVPSWVVDRRGHDLLPIAQKAFNGPGIVNPPRLIKAMRRCRMVPRELASLLDLIQRA